MRFSLFVLVLLIYSLHAAAQGLEPTVTFFDPVEAKAGSAITITGTNFNGATSVTFGGVEAASFTVVSPTKIIATTAGGASGTVIVTTPAGTGARSGFVFYKQPVVNSFTPTAGTTFTLVTITGSDFTGTTSVKFGGVPASSFYVVSSTSITAVVAAGASGDVSVTTLGGTGSLSGFVYTLPPSISSYSPLSGKEGTKITITGTNFTGASQVTFGGTAATFTVVSPTEIAATLTTGASGNVTVTTAGGTATSPGFVYDPKARPNNFITPNGDGLNDTWQIEGINAFQDNEVSIMDGAGRLIFKAKKYANNWDGTANGRQLAQGTYYYIIRLNNGDPDMKGFITLIRRQ